MEKTKKIKLFIGLFYLILVALFLYYLFSKFTFQQLTSYDFIKDNIVYFSELKKSNLFLLSASFSYNEIGREAIVSEITFTQLQTVDSLRAVSFDIAWFDEFPNTDGLPYKLVL